MIDYTFTYTWDQRKEVSTETESGKCKTEKEFNKIAIDYIKGKLLQNLDYSYCDYDKKLLKSFDTFDKYIKKITDEKFEKFQDYYGKWDFVKDIRNNTDYTVDGLFDLANRNAEYVDEPYKYKINPLDVEYIKSLIKSLSVKERRNLLDSYKDYQEESDSDEEESESEEESEESEESDYENLEYERSEEESD